MKGLRLALVAFASAAVVTVAAATAAAPPAAAALGVYRLAGGGFASLLFVQGRLRVAEYGNGLYRTLLPQARGLYVGGPGASVTSPVRVRVRIESPSRVAVNGQQATRLPLVAQDVSFRHGSVRLGGRLLRPPGRGPFAAVVIVPGSEPASRTDYDLWADFYAAQGLAVLTYDKRGVGASGGTYDRASDEANLRLLAGDALAGLDWLRRQAGIDPRRVGLSGGSQAGWVIAIAAAHSPNVAFAALQSAPAMSVGRQRAYSALTRNGWSDPGSDAAVQAALANAGATGYDPRADIAALRVPVLWQLGALDRRMFTPESVADLQQIANPEIQVRVYPGGAHSLRPTPDGLVRQEQAAPGYIPSVFADLAAWLRLQVLGK